MLTLINMKLFLLIENWFLRTERWRTGMCVNMSNMNSVISLSSRPGPESWSGIECQK